MKNKKFEVNFFSVAFVSQCHGEAIDYLLHCPVAKFLGTEMFSVGVCAYFGV